MPPTFVDRSANIAVCVVLLALGAASLPYLLHYSAEIAYTAIRAEDELAFIRVVEALLTPQWSIDYFRQFNSFGYGALWWAILAAVAAPFKLAGSEQGMVVSLRLLSLLSSLAGFYLAYAAVRTFVTRRLDVFAAALALVVVCFFTELVFINSTYIHPETLYCAFLMAAFHQLARAQGQVNRNFYWSVVWLVVAASIKLLAVLFAVAYAVFWWLGPRGFSGRTLLKIAGVALITALALNPWMLHPALLHDAVSTLRIQSALTRKGWPELHHTWTLENSISYFSEWYVGLGVLLAVLALALVTAGFLWSRAGRWKDEAQTARVFCMAFAVVAVYAAFCLFYAWQPVHYGIVSLYLLPVLAVTMLELLPVFGMQRGAAAGWSMRIRGSAAVVLAVAAICWFQTDSLVAVFNIARQPAGEVTNLARYRAINRIRDILGSYQGAMNFIGVAHDLAVPLVKGRRIDYWNMNALPADLVGKSDVLIFWKRDYAYDMKYLKREPSDPAAFGTFNRIRNGETFGAADRKVAFRKLLEDDEFEVYGHTGGMTVHSASTSRRHPGERAFDGSTAPDDFWEAEGPFPHSITLHYPADQAVAGYQLSVGEFAKRMPRAWRFEGSRDGTTWSTLDARAGEKPWTPGETRSYALKTAASYPYYQFTFTAGFETNILRIYEIRLRN